MTRAVLIRRGTARALALAACLVAAYCAAPARSSGLEAPEVARLSEAPVGREIAGRLYAVQPDSPIAFRGVPVAGWGGCWDCPTRPGVIDDEAPPVPLPGAAWLMLAGLGAMVAVKWRKA